MARDNFFDNACCNKHCDTPDNNSDISFIWMLIIVFLFRGNPFGYDCFWNGYCNAFNSSGFSCGSSSNNINNNFNNINDNNFFNTN